MVRRPQHYPHTGVDGDCRFGCGEPVTIFTDDATGFIVQLERQPPLPSVDTTSPDCAHRLWEFRGVHLGWVNVWQGQRSWRPHRLEHDCDHTPAHHKPRRAHPAPPTTLHTFPTLPAPAVAPATPRNSREGDPADERPVRRAGRPGQSQVD